MITPAPTSDRARMVLLGLVCVAVLVAACWWTR